MTTPENGAGLRVSVVHAASPESDKPAPAIRRRWFQWVLDNPFPVAIGVGLLAGYGAYQAVDHSGLGRPEAAATPVLPRVTASAPANTPNSIITPEQNSGGSIPYQGTGSAALECVGVRIVPLGNRQYDVTPIMTGNAAAPELQLHTIATQDDDTVLHGPGIATLRVDGRNNVIFPFVSVLNIAGTGLTPDDLGSLLGDRIPVNDIFPCPPQHYPDINDSGQ